MQRLHITPCNNDGLWSGWRSHLSSVEMVNGLSNRNAFWPTSSSPPNFTRGVPSAGLGELFFQTPDVLIMKIEPKHISPALHYQITYSFNPHLCNRIVPSNSIIIPHYKTETLNIKFRSVTPIARALSPQLQQPQLVVCHSPDLSSLTI